MEEEVRKNIEHVKIEDEMQGAYLEYAMSVIAGRALPDARDGMKPVQRRVIYTMKEMGNYSDKRYLKSARVVGDVLGKYHPHGDAPVYGAMVRLAQDFNLRYPLVDGQGNFGSIDGDSAAAMRYTEVRMSKIAEELIADIDKETVEFVPNYDGSLQEPKVLPTKVPNLLINGSTGIAVGMSTNIPPHNLGEVVRGVVALIEDPEISVMDLMKYVPAPDFPTAGIISNINGIRHAYMNGRGSLTLKGKAEIEQITKEKEAIIITEFPYMVNKADWISNLADLVRDKVVEGISDIRDESDRKGIRVVIELKRGEPSGVILNTLFAKTQLQTSVSFIMLAIDNGRPKLFSLKELLKAFLEHRKDVVTKRCVFDLNKAEARAHILEGLKIALDNIDAVVETIKKSSGPEQARLALGTRFGLSEKQAQAILEMRLQRLTALETQKIIDELKETLAEIERLKIILGSESELLKVIKTELEEILQKYTDPRKSQISYEDDKEFVMEDFVKDEQVVVTISSAGYAKRLPVDTYRAQGRGGKGVKGASTGSEDSQDFIQQIFTASTLSYLLCFTNLGRLHWLKVHRIPEMNRTARGRPLVQLLTMQADERVLSVLPVSKFEEGKFVFMTTKKGIVKKTDLMAFSNVRASGIIAASFDEGDELVDAAITTGDQTIFIATKEGQSIRFSEKDVRDMGRTARGVKGIELSENDEVVGVSVLPADDESKDTILSVSNNGYGKRSPLSEYRIQGRAGSGIINIKVTEKIGSLVSVKKVTDADDLIIISDKGKVIRTPVNDISIIGRNTQGVRVISLEPGECVKAIAVAKDEDSEGEGKVTQ